MAHPFSCCASACKSHPLDSLYVRDAHETKDASLQEDAQGGFEVETATHRSGLPPVLDGGGGMDPLGGGGHMLPRIKVSIPAGTVVVYSPNVVHRGRANQLKSSRVVSSLPLSVPLSPQSCVPRVRKG